MGHAFPTIPEASTYRDEYGVTFRTLEPLNEPFANWWKQDGSQEGCQQLEPLSIDNFSLVVEVPAYSVTTIVVPIP